MFGPFIVADVPDLEPRVYDESNQASNLALRCQHRRDDYLRTRALPPRTTLPDPDHCSLEDNEEEGDTQSYFFLRHRDSATVVYKVAVGLSTLAWPPVDRWSPEASIRRQSSLRYFH